MYLYDLGAKHVGGAHGSRDEVSKGLELRALDSTPQILYRA